MTADVSAGRYFHWSVIRKIRRSFMWSLSKELSELTHQRIGMQRLMLNFRIFLSSLFVSVYLSVCSFCLSVGFLPLSLSWLIEKVIIIF